MQLYELGYYQMPMYMQEMILVGLQRKENETVWVQDRTPNPLPSVNNATNDKRYSTLSRGLYEEVKVKKPYEQYGRFTLNTTTKKIESLESESNFQFLIDPVVFAWSVDPLAAKFPSWSPYAAFANNPIIYVDTDGRDTLVMHRSTQLQEKSNSETAVYKVTFSIIENGIKRPLDLELFMVSNIEADKRDDNALSNPTYKLVYDKMSNHPDWDNTIRITEDGVFIHPGKDISWLGGCKFLCSEFETVSESNVQTSLENSIKSLKEVKNLYNANKNKLTGEKFLLFTNSQAVRTPETPIEIETMKATSIQTNTQPLEIKE